MKILIIQVSSAVANCPAIALPLVLALSRLLLQANCLISWDLVQPQGRSQKPPVPPQVAMAQAMLQATTLLTVACQAVLWQTELLYRLTRWNKSEFAVIFVAVLYCQFCCFFLSLFGLIWIFSCVHFTAFCRPIGVVGLFQLHFHFKTYRQCSAF